MTRPVGTKLAIPQGPKLPRWSPRTIRPVWKNASPEFLAKLLDPPFFFQAFVDYEGAPLRLDGWQVAFLRRRARFRALTKSVQIGYSFVCAMEALHMALFYEDEDSVFVSVNENDAKNKILFAQKLYDGLAPEIARFVPIVSDSREELWFGRRERPSRLLSKPATSGLRGIAAHVYLDEVDHYRPGQDIEVFTAAMGRVTRAKRRLTVGSSVFGEETILSKIMEPGQYPDFLKFELPWWTCEVPDQLASIDIQRRNMPREDFAQEYECVRADFGDSAFPQNLIRECWNDRTSAEWDRLDPAGTFIGGFDPGGSRHPAVLTVLQQVSSGWDQVVQLEIRGEPLAEQQARLDSMLATLPHFRLAIDRLGLGQQMSEELERRWGRRVLPLVFNRQLKSQMTVDLKKAMEDGKVGILRDRELAHQLNKTRRLPGGEVVQAGVDKRTHFDKYWALAMAGQLVSSLGSVYESRGFRSISWGEDVA